MSWHPNDLVADQDLVAYEASILTQFGQADWETRRLKAIEDWLAPILRGQGHQIEQLRTRYEATKVSAFTAGLYIDATDAAKTTTPDDLDLAAIFADPGTDRLYIGSSQMFRGLSVRLHDTVSVTSATLAVKYWNDAWTALSVADGTVKSLGIPFSGGGALTWRVPSDWVKRTVDDSARLYWTQLSVSSPPSPGTAGQIGTIRRSALCAPVTMRTLTLIMREAPTGGSGPWLEKAAWYETEADAALQRALPLIAGEFDTDDDDLINPDEEVQTPPSGTAGGTAYRLERY
jgi:hypothetical protein